MRRRDFIALAGASAVAWPMAAGAQVAAKLPRIAYLDVAATPANFIQGLADFGYADGRNIVIEIFSAPTAEEISVFAAKAVASKPDVILASGVAAASAAKALTQEIPIVFSAVSDPVAVGLVSNLPRPGANLTGTSVIGPLLAGKALELLRELFPQMSKVTLFAIFSSATTAVLLSQLRSAGGALGIEISSTDVPDGGDFAPYVAAAKAGGAQAIYVYAPLLNGDNGIRLNDLARLNGLPTIATNATNPDKGGLLSYGVNAAPVARRSAYYVDQILRGAKPGDLAVEQPNTLELVINLKTAKALGIAIPPTVLFRADRVIE